MTVKEEERLIGTSTKRDVSSRDESGSRSITQYSTREIQVSLKGEARVVHIKAGAGFLAWLTLFIVVTNMHALVMLDDAY